MNGYQFSIKQIARKDVKRKIIGKVKICIEVKKLKSVKKKKFLKFLESNALKGNIKI